MTGAQRPGRFRPGEVDASDLGPGSEAELLGTARELEWFAMHDDVGPTTDFADRVMAAISREPAPRPVAAALGAARRRSPVAVLAALGDLWRVAFSGGRPLAARFPAIALVALLVLGSVGVGAVGAGALAGFLGRAPAATPVVSPSPLARESPSPSPSPSPSMSPGATESAEPSGQPETLESPEPSSTEVPDGGVLPTSDVTDHTPRPTREPGATERPTQRAETQHPGDTPAPGGTPRPTDGSGGG